MQIAYYTHKGDNEPKRIEASWQELCELLTTYRVCPCTSEDCQKKDCPHKNGPAFSPVSIDGIRKWQNVTSINALVLDLDHLTLEQLTGVAERIDHLAHIFYSSHSSTPDDLCGRLVLRLAEPFKRREGEKPAHFRGRWEALLQAVVRAFQIPADPHCKDLARLYFLPSCPKDAAPLFVASEGEDVDARALMEASINLIKAQSQSTQINYTPPEAASVDLEDLRKTLKVRRYQYGRSGKDGDDHRHDLLDRLLKGVALAEKGDRDTSINTLAGILAFTLPHDTPRSAIAELFRPCLSLMPHEPETLEYWQSLALEKYERALQRSIKATQERDAQNLALRERMANLIAVGQADWTERLKTKKDGSLLSCGFNMGLILERSEETKGTFRFNEVTKKIEIVGGPFEGEPEATLDVAVSNWFQEIYGLLVKPAEAGPQIARVARLNSYDPLKEYLIAAYKKWDGKPRIDDFLITYFNAVDTDDFGESILDTYLRKIGPRWLISCVARGLEPGSKVDTVLILEGEQGLKKSSAFRVLGGKWFYEGGISFFNKDSWMLAGQVWIAELGELTAFAQSEKDGKLTRAQKNFFSQCKDTFRPPYGRVLEESPRRAVFVGTTNPEENESGYLFDPTGNRRFWPVRCRSVDLERLIQDREQLWGEAVARFYAGERWWLEPEEQVFANRQTDQRMPAPTFEPLIWDWWVSLPPAKRPRRFTSAQLAQWVLQVPLEKATERSLQTKLGGAASNLGFTKRRERVGSVAPWFYYPTDALVSEPQKIRTLQGKNDANKSQGTPTASENHGSS